MKTYLTTPGGNRAKDQYTLTIERNGKRFEQFFSYDTLIAELRDDVLVLSSYHNHSATTGKYLNQFSGTTKPQRNKMIEAGTLKVVQTTRETTQLEI